MGAPVIPSAPRGPLVRVTRGQNTSVAAAGMAGAARGMVSTQSNNIRDAAGVVSTGVAAGALIP
jgi:hypothetical protein